MKLERPRKAQPVINIELVNTESKDTVLFRFFGQTEEVTLTFAIWDDGSERSGGDSITSVAQQITYLWETIFTKDFDASWDLWETGALLYTAASPFTGVITNLEFDIKEGANTVVIGSITLRRGRIGFTS